MRTEKKVDEPGRAPLWIRRPSALLLTAHGVAAVVFIGQLATAILSGAGLVTVVAVVVAGIGIALSWLNPWVGLIVTSAASFAVTAIGDDPVSVWMISVLVLFSFTFRGKPSALGTGIVAIFFFAGLIMSDAFGGSALVPAAALFSAIGGGATGAALRLSRDHWLVSEERARTAVATRELEAGRRVTEERLRIARDLHDIVGHQVAMLSVNLGVAEIGLPEQATSSRQALEAARSNARNVVSETQRILVVLRRGDSVAEEDALRPTPTLSGLDSLIASFESIGLGVDAAISLSGELDDSSLGVTVYRVIQEALTNAYRHGEGSAVVEVMQDADGIRLSVANSIGRDNHEIMPGSGLGLVGMRERIESCGGTMSVESVNGRFRVSADFSPIGARQS
jgi:signal transduction histidine kinase